MSAPEIAAETVSSSSSVTVRIDSGRPEVTWNVNVASDSSLDLEDASEADETNELLRVIHDSVLSMHRYSSASGTQLAGPPMSPVPQLRGIRRARPPLERGLANRFATSRQLITALESLEEHIRQVYRDHGMDKANILVGRLATIPLLLEAIMLWQNGEERREILSLPCIRRVLSCKQTILPKARAPVVPSSSSSSTMATLRNRKSGESESWIMRFLQPKQIISATQTHEQQHRVLDYLELISTLSVLDYIAVFLTDRELEDYELQIYQPDEETVQAFQEERDELFNTISGFVDLIPHVFSLSNEMAERAALLPVVHNAVHDAVQRPFMIATVFTDLFFHVTLLLAARNYILLDINYFNKDHGDVTTAGIFLLVCFGPPSVFYMVFRLVTDLMAFAQLSWAAFVQNLWYRWTIVDILAVIVVVWGVLSTDIHVDPLQVREHFTFQAFALGVLWLKALGFLQVLNHRLSAYIVSLFEMLSHIRLFLLIFLVIVFGFGDMFHTIYTVYRDDNSVCPDFGNSSLASRMESRTGSPFCNTDRFVSYLGVYGLLVGDVSVNDYNANAVTSTLFVTLSFVGVILLLNMLIALVLESYERSLARSKSLFGRTRVALATKNILLEQSLRSKGWVGTIMRILSGVVVCCIFSYMVGISLYDFKFDATGSDAAALSVSIVTIFLLVYYAVVVFVYHFKGLGYFTNQGFLVQTIETTFTVFIAIPATWITRSLLGMNASHGHVGLGESSDPSDDSSSDLLDRRLARLEKTSEQILEKLEALGEKLKDKKEQKQSSSNGAS